MTRLRSFGTGGPDMEAAAQQLAIIASLYKDRRDAVEQLLGSDGEVLIWEFREISWPPSWCLIRCGDGRYFMVIAGTASIAHWAVHYAGYRGTPPGIVGGTVNAGWYYAWYHFMKDLVRAEIDARGDPAELHYSGHSYGSALANIAAVEDRGHYPGAKVQVITFAQPKTYLGGQAARMPEDLYRLRSYNDAVPYTPPERKYAWIGTFTPLVSWANAILKWQHYGDDYWIAPNGELGTGHTAPDPLPPGVSVGFVSEHYTLNYWGRLNAWYHAHSGGEDMREALLMAHQIITGEEQQELAGNLPSHVIGPTGVPVPIPFYPGYPDDDELEEMAMAQPFPTPLAGGRLMRLTMFFNAKDAGWDEGFQFHYAGSGDPYEAVKSWAALYIPERLKVMDVSSSMDYLRISDEAIRGDSYPLVKPDLGMGPGKRTGGGGSPNNGWQLTLMDETRTVRALRPTRGYPEALLPEVMAFGVHVRPQSSAMNTFLTKVRALLTKAAPVGFDANLTPCIPSRAKNPATTTTWTITEFGVDTTGRLQVTLAPSANPIDQGEVLYVTHKRTLGVTGVNGAHTVVAGDFSGPLPVITFASRPPVDITELAGQTGTLARRGIDLVVIKHVDILRASYRQTGRPTAGSRGRRREKR